MTVISLMGGDPGAVPLDADTAGSCRVMMPANAAVAAGAAEAAGAADTAGAGDTAMPVRCG